MHARTFEQLKLSRIIAFRRECVAQGRPADDSEVVELERRLDAIRDAMVEPFPSQAWFGG
jgi:hypothetical protein